MGGLTAPSPNYLALRLTQPIIRPQSMK